MQWIFSLLHAGAHDNFLLRRIGNKHIIGFYIDGHYIEGRVVRSWKTKRSGWTYRVSYIKRIPIPMTYEIYNEPWATYLKLIIDGGASTYGDYKEVVVEVKVVADDIITLQAPADKVLDKSTLTPGTVVKNNAGHIYMITNPRNDEDCLYLEVLNRGGNTTSLTNIWRDRVSIIRCKEIWNVGN